MELLKRIGIGIVRLLVTEAATRTLAVLLLAVALGGALIFPGVEELLFGSAAALLLVTITQLATRWYNIRHDDYVVTKRIVSLELLNNGHDVIFTETLTVRSRVSGLDSIKLRLAWSGDTQIDQVAEVVGEGLTLATRQETDHRGRAIPGVLLTLSFEDRIRRWRKKTVGVRLRIVEPNLAYEPYLDYDTGQVAHSSFARIIFNVTWDNTEPILARRARAKEYRHRMDLKLERRGAVKLWDWRQLADKKNPQMLRWVCWPTMASRFYYLSFPLHPAQRLSAGNVAGNGGKMKTTEGGN